MRTIARAVTMSLVLPMLLVAQAALDGKWQGETRNGSHILLELKASKKTLTGTLTRNGQSSTIADGNVSKNTFTFKATLNDQTEGFTGELARDEIKVWMDRVGPESTVVLKRVKN